MARLALLSVSDKTGLLDFARRLAAAGFDLVSTGGTAKALRDGGLAVRDVSEVTGFPEMLDGRVKTLHPAVHGGLLARRDLAEHLAKLAEHGIEPIDLVAVNLYPFAETAAKPGASREDVVEQIDIGGPSMLRSAAKNHAAVTVVCDPADYAAVADEIEGHGDTLPGTRRSLAAKVFQHTAAYDGAIANWMARQEAPAGSWPAVLNISMPIAYPLRYGENPHQGAAFYRDPSCTETCLAGARQLQGKELSYNNLLDGEGALEAVRDFAQFAPCAAVIVKHANPCGIAVGEDIATAYERARATDPDSAFGGIIALSAEVDEETARMIAESFNEVVIAPGFGEAALAVLAAKKNLRLLATGPFTPKRQVPLVRGIVGGALAMDRDLADPLPSELRVVTKAQPGADDLDALCFAWRCAKWVKSNAIVYSSRTATLGIGAGQMSRIDATRLGAQKCRGRLEGSYMASDAFFPFRDCVDIAAEHKVRAIIQPGGSVRDAESIAAADEHGIAMVFTGMRHFRH